MNTPWIQTHVIEDTSRGRTIKVMECDGCYYTREEWDACEKADWTEGEGFAIFQGDRTARVYAATGKRSEKGK